MRLPVNTVIHTTLVGLEPATFRSLVDCWSDALPVVSPTHVDVQIVHDGDEASRLTNQRVNELVVKEEIDGGQSHRQS